MAHAELVRVDASQSYKPLPKIKTWHKSPAFEKILMGGFGSGKTKALVWHVTDRCMQFERNRWLVARDTSGDLADSTMHDFLEECPSELIIAHRKKEGKVVLANYSEVIFRSFRSYYESVHSQKQSRLKALNLGGAAVDEVSETSEQNWRLLKGRLRLPHIPSFARELIGATNPPDNDHWIAKGFDAYRYPDAKDKFLLQVSSRDNPYLPADYIENMEKDYPPSWVSRYIDGNFGFILKGDPVYDSFRETVNGLPWHVGPTEFIRGRPVYRDWDFGWHHPAVVWSQDDLEGRWRVHREEMGEKVYIWDFAPKIIRISNDLFPGAEFIDFCDPAGNQKSDRAKRSSIEILKEDFHIHPRFRMSHVKDGIDIIQRKLNSVTAGEPDIRFNKEGCPILIQGMLGGYAREKPVDGRGMTDWQPIKDGYYEHLQDAMRMGAINRYTTGRGAQARSNFRVGSPNWSGIRVASNAIGRM